MSDHERWDETRRLDPDETRRADRGGSESDRTQRLDPDRTSRLGAEEEAAGAGAGPTREFDAVGDTTYEDPYGASYGEPTAAEDEVAGEPAAAPRRRDGLRAALLVLLGLGLGFVAALVVVALFGGQGADPEAVTARDERISALEDELAGAEQRNAELQETLEQREEQIEELQGGLADAEQSLAERQQELDDRERALDQRGQQLDEREEELDEREEALEEREQEQEQPGQDGDGDADPPPDGNGDGGLPEVDQEEAEALVDRVLERIRELFR